jgi:DNA polymerase-3 subunit delta
MMRSNSVAMGFSLRYRSNGAQPMKLTLDSLPAQLSQRLLPTYLVSGDDPLRTGEACDLIRARARAAGFEERQVFFIERAASIWAEAEQSAQSLSLFSARRIVEIRLPTGKAGVSGGAALQRLVAASGDDLLLLVITGQLERDTQSADWVRAVESRGGWLNVQPLSRAQLPAWLRQRSRAAGLDLAEDAAMLLADRCEGNLLAARQEIDKLALLLPPGARADAADVAASSTESARYDVGQLGDAIRRSDPARALRILGGLAAEGAEPPLVLWILLRELRSQAGARGRAPVTRLVARAVRADRLAKHVAGATGDAWDELMLLAVELCGVRTLPLLHVG